MDLLSIRKAAEKCGVSPRHLRRQIDNGRLRVTRLGETAKSDRIHPDDLDDYINRSRTCLSAKGESIGSLTSASQDAELGKALEPLRKRDEKRLTLDEPCLGGRPRAGWRPRLSVIGKPKSAA